MPVIGLVLVIVWASIVGYMALESWPRIPLDMGGADPATRAAYDRAVQAHVTAYAIIAVAPPLLAFAAAWLTRRLFPRTRR